MEKIIKGDQLEKIKHFLQQQIGRASCRERV